MIGDVLPCGERAVLVELTDLDAALALYRALDADRPEDAEDLVLGARTVLVTVRHPGALPDAVHAVRAALARTTAAGGWASRHEVVVDVRYDGPDLAEVAELTGMSPDEVVAAHTGTPWRVAFGGFAPGFAYLVGGDPRLDVPRKAEPRTTVPAGSVGLAGAFSGIYPRSSPGGWQLLGTTDAPLWDAERPSPALLTPGTTVRFHAVEVLTPAIPPASVPPVTTPRVLRVVRPGPRTTIQDAGRPGWAHVGVTASGAADRTALRLANRLVGNPEHHAALEVLLGGLQVTAGDSLAIAVTGAHAPATLNGEPVPHAGVLYLTAGDTLALGTPATGLRSYVAVAGGIDVEPVLGSRSSDTLSGLGPDALGAGDVLGVGVPPPLRPLPTQVPPLHGEEGPLILEALPGPRSHWLADLDALAGPWRVSDQADRVGVRLIGTPLARRPEAVGVELPSEGVVRGAIQLPGNGMPLVFGPDHPVTGGYPVIAVLTEASCDLLAQARPGRVVELRPPD